MYEPRQLRIFRCRPRPRTRTRAPARLPRQPLTSRPTPSRRSVVGNIRERAWHLPGRVVRWSRRRRFRLVERCHLGLAVGVAPVWKSNFGRPTIGASEG